MNTKFIGVKEFRQNMAKLAKRAQDKNERLVVLRKNEPIFEVRPFKNGENVLTRLLNELQEAQAEVSSGKFYTEEEIIKEFGI